MSDFSEQITFETRPQKKLVALVTKSRSGTVSVIRDLTEQQASDLKTKLMPTWEGLRMCQDGDIVECHVI